MSSDNGTNPNRRGPGRPVGSSGPARRAALLDAAQEILAEKGLPRVTVREVAERAGVKPALVNYYFGSKDDLLRAVADRISAKLLDRIGAVVSQGGGAEERLANLVRATVSVMGADRYAPRLIAEQVLFGEDEVIDDFVANYASKNLENIAQVLQEGQRDGVFRDVNPMFLIPALFGSSLFFFLAEPILKRLYGVPGITPELAQQFAEHQAELLLNGVLKSPADRNPT